MGQPQWQRFAGSIAENYSRFLVPAMFEPWGEDLVGLAAPQPGERVLDVACGTGVVTRLAARRAGPGQVTGLDISPAMLEMARSQPAEVPVSWQEGSVLELPFADATFDLVLCQQGVQFFPDRAAGLREMARVLVPGGRLAVAAWAPIGQSPGFDALAVALERHVSAAAAAAARSPYALSDAGELRGLLAAAGLRDVAVDSRTMLVRFPSPAELVGQYVRSSPIAAVLGDVADAALEPVMREVAEALASYVDDRGLAFPTESHLARAVRPAPPVPPATG